MNCQSYRDCNREGSRQPEKLAENIIWNGFTLVFHYWSRNWRGSPHHFGTENATPFSHTHQTQQRGLQCQLPRMLLRTANQNSHYKLKDSAMLVLSRKQQEFIQIGDDVVVKIIKTARGSVKIGIEAPGDKRILRGEIDLNSDSIPVTELVRAITSAESPSHTSEAAFPAPALV